MMRHLHLRKQSAAPPRHVPHFARLLGLFVGTALALYPGTASAHLKLQSTAPAAGDTLLAAPTELRLTFSLPVELAFSQLTLIGPGGGETALGEIAVAAGSPEVVTARIVAALRAGEYTVRWQVATADAHPVRGEYKFAIAAGAGGLATAPGSGTIMPPPVEAPTPTAEAVVPGAANPFGPESPLYAAVRWLTFAGLLGVIGAVSFRAVVLALAGRGADAETTALLQRMARNAAPGGLIAGLLLLFALGLRLFAQSVALSGAEAAFDRERLGVLLGGTVWGWGWWLQAAGVVLVLAGFVLARRKAAGLGWAAALLGALVLGFTPALSGHAAASGALAVMVDGLHVLGAGGWLGSLLFVVAIGLPAALRQPAAEERGVLVARLVNAFSPAALAFASVVVATGAFAAWRHMGALSPLWQSDYGRTLLWKLGVLSIVFATGAYNWLRVKPRLGTTDAALHLRRSATLELAAGMVVLAITAVLVATPPPAEMQMAETTMHQLVNP